MKLSELILAVGDENVRFQTVAQSLVGSKTNRKGETTLELATREVTTSEVYLNKGSVGLLVWIPRDKFLAATGQGDQGIKPPT